jgi:HK97 gp10 family phage protein
MARGIIGLDRMKRKLRRLAPETRAEIRKALDASANEIVSTAKRLAPVDDGDLQGSIRKEGGDHDLAVKVLAGGPRTTKPVRNTDEAPLYDYALGQEFGTQDMLANPFFFPAVRATRKGRRRRISAAVRRAARKVAGK